MGCAPVFLCGGAPFRSRSGSRGPFVSIPTFSGIEFLKSSLASFNSSLVASSWGAFSARRCGAVVSTHLRAFLASFWSSTLLLVDLDLFGHRFPEVVPRFLQLESLPCSPGAVSARCWLRAASLTRGRGLYCFRAGGWLLLVRAVACRGVGVVLALFAPSCRSRSRASAPAT